MYNQTLFETLTEKDSLYYLFSLLTPHACFPKNFACASVSFSYIHIAITSLAITKCVY